VINIKTIMEVTLSKKRNDVRCDEGVTTRSPTTMPPVNFKGAMNNTLEAQDHDSL
jgi:hypothetical protein